MSFDEVAELIRGMGLPAFRAGQLFSWMHARPVRTYAEMSDLPKELRERLEREYPLTSVTVMRQQESAVDGTRKFLYGLSDGESVETVFMRYRYGDTVCVSSQAGCRMGCRFCASTLGGLVRNLLPSEMLEQVYETARITGSRISHVVIMGTGEPFDNYDNVVRFIRLLTDERGLHLSQRNITLSTCGIVPGIVRFAREDLSVTLALSLHAVSDVKRAEIMPVASKWTISELMDACREYFQLTGRRVTFEYSLISGVNDSIEDAVKLASLARSVHAHINLIPVNPVRERGYQRPDRDRVGSFKKELEKRNINVSVRRALGKDIDGACGQLRRRALFHGGENA